VGIVASCLVSAGVVGWSIAVTAEAPLVEKVLLAMLPIVQTVGGVIFIGLICRRGGRAQ